MQTQIYNQKGESVKKMELPEEVFGLDWNADLVHQVVVSMTSNQRDNIAHTKNRGDVRGGGKKPWRQKGTGRARHGSNRSPIWKGGGVTFGPTNEKNWSKKINKKMKVKALLTVLSQKLRDGEVLFVDEFKFDAPKTKDAQVVLNKLSEIKGFENIVTKKNNSAFMALGGRDENTEKSFSNFSNIEMGELRSINSLDILGCKYLVITKPQESVDFLASKLVVEKSVEKIKNPKNSQTNFRTER